MGEIKVSLAVSRNMFAIVFDENGLEKQHNVDKIRGSSDNMYLNIIRAFTSSLRYVRQYISDNKGVSDVIFVVSNSIFIKWMENQYSKSEYQNDFVKMLRLLNELPISYDVVYNDKPLAQKYLGVVEDNDSLSGLDIN